MSNTVDREKECPFLLKVFYCHGRHNPTQEYTVDRLPSTELCLYTWRNATLEEIAGLIEQIVPEARDPDARIAFRLMYLDSERARYNSREIGRVVPAKPTEDQKKTLADCNFLIGDYLDVAIYVGPPPSFPRGGPNSRYGVRGGYHGYRDNNRGRPAFGGGNKFNNRRRRSFDRNSGAPYNRDRFGGGSSGGYQRRDKY